MIYTKRRCRNPTSRLSDVRGGNSRTEVVPDLSQGAVPRRPQEVQLAQGTLHQKMGARVPPAALKELTLAHAQVPGVSPGGQTEERNKQLAQGLHHQEIGVNVPPAVLS